MDNAAKAIIMAGGILIAVAIISTAMYILTNARDFARIANDQARLETVQAFNSFYQSYGNTILGIDVLNIDNHVKNDKENGYDIGINVSKDLIDGLNAYTGAEYMDDIYRYEIDGFDSDGYITHVTVSSIT